MVHEALDNLSGGWLGWYHPVLIAVAGLKMNHPAHPAVWLS
jgi:hypothetical protein